MEHYWLNDGEPDANGTYTAQVRDDSGRVVSTYKGSTVKAVADQLLASNANASKELARLKASRQPDKAPAVPVIGQPRELTADDRFRMAAELEDPAKAPEAIKEIITAATGASPEAIHQTLANLTERERIEYQKAETDKFVQANPDYYPDDRNKARIIQALQLKGWDWTSNNLQNVYDELQSSGLLITGNPDDEDAVTETHEQQPGARQADSNQSAEPNPPRQQTRPRRAAASTGIRHSDTSATRPPSTAPARYTRAQIEAMPKAEYLEKLRDPRFVAEVNGMRR